MTGNSPVFSIEQNEERGRHVVAVRDILPGEIILTDRPLIVTPHTKSRAQCLQCARLVDGTYLCPLCNFPMCSETCSQGDTHRPECQTLSRVNFEADIEDLTVADDHYAAILPLRCLHLAETDKEGWETFQSFLSHAEERGKKNVELEAYHREHCVEFVRDICERGEDYSEQDILTMIGIMTTNGLDISLGKGYGELMGFYPVFSNLNHSCLANAKPVKKRDQTVEVRAKREIRAGEEICIQYLLDTQPTRLRRQLIARKWLFLCSCHRCSDRTEAGTFLDGLQCQSSSCEGRVLPVSPLDTETEYSCDQCEAHTSHTEVTNIFNQAESEVRKRVGADRAIQHMESVIEKYGDILLETNYVMTNIKMKLGCLYGNLPPSSVLEKMSPAELQRKLEYCKQGLDIINILDEGNLGENTWKLRLEKEIMRTNFVLLNLLQSR